MTKKTEAAVVRTTMRRYRKFVKDYPVFCAEIVARKEMGIAKNPELFAMVRACHAHAKSTKPKGKR